MEAMDSTNSRKYFACLLAIIVLSIFFRFYNLELVPKWDFDEGYNMRYAYDMVEGKLLWFSIKYTFIPHPPLFFMAYALVVKFLGVGVYTLRLLVAFYGVLTTIVLYYAGRELFNPKVGLTASFIYAVAPEVVFWNRIGFANNQLIFLSALSLLFVYRYSKTLNEGYLLLGSFMAGLSAITEYTGFVDIAVIVFYLYLYHRKSIPKALIASFTPAVALFVFMLYHSPEYFLFDVKYQLNRFFSPAKILLGVLFVLVLIKLRKRISNFYKPIAEELNDTVFIYVFLVSLIVFITSEQGFWRAETYLIAMCVFGFCLIPPFLIKECRERRLLVLFLSFNIIYLLAIDRADHMPMVLHPFISLAVAAFFCNTYENTVSNPPWLFRKFKISLPKKLLFAMVFCSLLVAVFFTAYLFVLGKASVEQVDRDIAVAEYVNQHANAGDVVLTYSWMFPMITKAKVSLLTQSLAYENIPIAYYSGEFPKERFEFNTSYRRARFLVASNGTFEWILNQTNRSDAAYFFQNWSKTEVAGLFIYERPV